MLETLQHHYHQEVMHHWELLAHSNGNKPHTLTTIAGRPARHVIDELGDQLTTLLLKSDEIARSCCPTTKRTLGKQHQHYYNRKTARKLHRVILQKRAIATRLAALKQNHNIQGKTATESGPEQREVHRRLQTYKQQHPEAQEKDALQAVRKQLNTEQAHINKEHTKLTEQAARQRAQQLMDERQSVGNKQATGKWQPQSQSNLRILQTTDEDMLTHPDKIIEYIEQYYAPKLAAPTGGVKTGKYLPGELPRDYPWEANTAPSVGKGLLPTNATSQRAWLHQAIDDEVAFAACLKTLAKGKAPGPDKVANEIIQALPDTGKQAMHHMIRLMWATGLTPTSWKQSLTVLLYKHKGTPLQLQYYRRIGLENTMYKVWTRMVTYALADRVTQYAQCITSRIPQ